jgi:hypothetical protein
MNSRTRSCGTDGVNNWHASSSLPGWVWKGDTSSDTITGHYFAYGVLLDHVAESEEEISRVVWALDRLTSYIVKHDYYFIDITGQPTKWGRWNPSDLNENSQYYSERGVNSLEILSYLALTYSVTGNEIYRKEYYRLGHEEEYLRNVLNYKLDNPFEDNHSDNQLGSSHPFPTPYPTPAPTPRHLPSPSLPIASPPFISSPHLSDSWPTTHSSILTIDCSRGTKNSLSQRQN